MRIKLSEAVMECPSCSIFLFKKDLKFYHNGHKIEICGIKCPSCGRFTPLVEAY